MRKFSIFIVLLSTLFLNVFAFSGTQNQAERAIDDGFNVMPGIVISATLNVSADMTAVITAQAADQFVMMTNNNLVAENVVLRTNEKQSRLQQPIKYFITSNGTPQFQLITLTINGDAISQDDGTAVTEEVETIYKWPNYNWGQVDVEKANYIVKIGIPARQLFLLNQAYLI